MLALTGCKFIVIVFVKKKKNKTSVREFILHDCYLLTAGQYKLSVVFRWVAHFGLHLVL